MEKPGLVAVTGVHRGGTSVVARALNLLGLSLGDPARLMPATSDNPGGYWENLRVAQLHDELLSVLGGWWSAPPVLTAGWERDPSLSPFWTWGAQIVQDHYEPFGRSLMKDPRLCFFLPFWRVLTTVEPVVVAVRHPAEVVSSLRRRDGFDSAHGAWLWLRHLDAVAALEPRALVVDYDDWFQRTDVLIERLVAHLDIPPPDEETRASITEWIRPDLRRSTPADGSDGPLLRAAASAYRELIDQDLPALAAFVKGLPDGWRANIPA